MQAITVKGDADILCKAIERKSMSRESDSSKEAGTVLARALATVDDLQELADQRPDRRLKRPKMTLVWSGSVWRDDPKLVRCPISYRGIPT